MHFSGVKLNLMSKATVQLHSKKQNTEQIISLKKNLGKLIHTTLLMRIVDTVVHFNIGGYSQTQLHTVQTGLCSVKT